MAKLWSAREVVEHALRSIGVLSPYDTTADEEHLRIGLERLDMVAGHYAAHKRMWWMVPATFTIEVTAGTAKYLLEDAIGPDTPPYGVLFPIMATWKDGNRLDEVRILSRREWELRDAPDDEGRPYGIHIDRNYPPNLYVHPTPDQSYIINLVAQTFTDTLTKLPPDRLTGFRSTWTLWLTQALAADLGDGPITKLPADEVKSLQEKSTRLFNDLCEYDNQEQADEPRRVDFYYF